MDNRNNPCNKTTFFVTLFLFKFWFKDNLSHYRPYLFLHIFPIYWWFLNVRNIRYLFAYSPFRGDGQKHPFMKNEQKVPNGIEIYAVKPNISSIRCVFFGQTSPRGEFVLLIIYIASIPTIILEPFARISIQAYSESVFDKSMILLNDIV